MDAKIRLPEPGESAFPTMKPIPSLKGIKSEIILGSPGMNCQGVGICKVMAYGEPFTGKCPVVTAWISMTEQNKWRFAFWKSTLDARLIKRHFGFSLFQVYEWYELPTDLTITLSPEPVQIQPGIYPVWETTQFLIVDF